MDKMHQIKFIEYFNNQIKTEPMDEIEAIAYIPHKCHHAGAPGIINKNKFVIHYC